MPDVTDCLDQQHTTTPANDNPNADDRRRAISFTALCTGLGLNEDEALQRLAGILARRGQQHEPE